MDYDHLGKLESAANAGSGRAYISWVALLSFGTYLAVALAGVSHVDLLLERSLDLPLLGVKLSLIGFFIAAPLIFSLLHLYFILILYGLGRQIFLYRSEVQRIVGTRSERDEYAARLDLFPFTQLLSGQRKSSVATIATTITVWMTTIVVPVFILNFFQVAFLPYHNVTITWYHRILIAFDLLLSFTLCVAVFHPSGRFSASIKHIAFRPFRNWRPLLGLAFLVGFVLVAEIFSLLIATVPDDAIERLTLNFLSGSSLTSGGSDDRCAVAAPERKLVIRLKCLLYPETWSQRQSGPFGVVWKPTWVLFEGDIDEVTRLPISPFSRNLVLPGLTYEPEAIDPAMKAALVVRGRDLRNANFTDARLRSSQFTDVNLTGAILNGANLTNAVFRCATPIQREAIPDRYIAKIVGPEPLEKAHRCTSLERSQFFAATLNNVTFSGVNLQNAQFRDAVVHNGTITKARMNGAILEETELFGSTIQDTELLGANLHFAKLTGSVLEEVNLAGARADGANFQRSFLQNVNFSGASLATSDLQCAILIGNTLVAVRFREANLNGALIRDATLSSTDFTGAMTGECDKTRGGLPDVDVFSPGGATAKAKALTLTKERIGKKSALQVDDHTITAWPNLDDSDSKQVDTLAEVLTELACRSAWIANGVLDRLLSTTSILIRTTTLSKMRDAQAAARCEGLRLVDFRMYLRQ